MGGKGRRGEGGRSEVESKEVNGGGGGCVGLTSPFKFSLSCTAHSFLCFSIKGLISGSSGLLWVNQD